MHQMARLAPVYLLFAIQAAMSGQATSTSSTSKATSMAAADQSRLHAALDAYDAGKLSEAEPALRRLSQKYPNNFEVDEALGSIYAESGDTERSLPLLIRACRAQPNQPIARGNLGALYLKLGKPEQAANELKAALSRDPGNPSTASNLGQALLLLHRPAEAAEAYRSAAAAAPGDQSILYNYSLALYESGDATHANENIAKLPPEARNEQVLSLAADAAEGAGDFERALVNYQALAKQYPTDPNLYSLVLELLRHWNWAEAARVAGYSVSMYPTSTHFQIAEGFAYYADNKFPQAVQTLSPLLASQPDSFLVADLLGRSCSLLPDGNDTECQAIYDFALRHPDNAVISTYAAASILKGPAEKQDLDKADRLLQAALKANPSYPEVYLELGRLEQIRQHWQQSADLLEHAIALRPSMAEAHYRLSRAYAHLGKHEEAKEQAALNQTYSNESRDAVNARMQEVMKFVLQPQ
jgi:predicted Zn-dependent protease